MSVVTNVMVTGLGGERFVASLNEWVANAECHAKGELRPVHDGAGGSKNLETEVWLAAFNYLTVADFIDAAQRLFAVETKRHRFGLAAQLFLKRQDDLRWFEIPLVADGTIYHERDRDYDRPA